jgi:hypothetical protein
MTVGKNPPPNPSPELTHLWRAKLTISNKVEYFHFRAPDDCSIASFIASQLSDSSDYVTMKAARLVSVECVGRLLN